MKLSGEAGTSTPPVLFISGDYSFTEHQDPYGDAWDGKKRNKSKYSASNGSCFGIEFTDSGVTVTDTKQDNLPLAERGAQYFSGEEYRRILARVVLTRPGERTFDVELEMGARFTSSQVGGDIIWQTSRIDDDVLVFNEAEFDALHRGAESGDPLITLDPVTRVNYMAAA